MTRIFLMMALGLSVALMADDLAQFERKAEMNPQDPSAQFNYAIKAREAKKIKAALKAVDRVIALTPRDAVAFELKGQLLLENGDEAGAVSALESCVNLDAKRSSAWAMLARIYSAKGDDKDSLKKAATAFEAASKGNPKNVKLVLNQGLVMSKLGDDKKAVSLFEKASKMEGGEALAARYLCQLYNVSGDNKKAELACMKAAQDPGASAETFYFLGFAQSRLGDKEAALKSFEKSVTLNPSYAPALYSLGFSDYEGGKLDEALRHFQGAVDAKGGDYPEARFNMAVVLGDLGRWTEAADIYRSILKKDPKNEDAVANLEFVIGSGTEALLNSGKDSYEAGEFDAAAKTWKQALELDPENSAAREFLSKVKNKSAKRDSASAARKAARKAVASKLKGEDDKVLKDGLAAYQAGKLSAAVKLLDFYARKHPENKKALQSLYKAKSQLLAAHKSGSSAAQKVSADGLKKRYFEGVDAYLEGDLPKAIEIWKKILAADPGHLDARRSLSQAEVELVALQKKK